MAHEKTYVYGNVTVVVHGAPTPDGQPDREQFTEAVQDLYRRIAEQKERRKREEAAQVEKPVA